MSGRANITAAEISAHVVEWQTRAGADIAIGQTINVDHEHCPAGADTRARLYITRKRADTGQTTDVAYCHNCGLGGAARMSGPTNIHTAASLRGVTARPGDPVALPVNLVPPGTEGFPEQATAFLGGRFDLPELGDVGVGFDRDSARLILPVWPAVLGHDGRMRLPSGNLLGWQARRLFGSGPKYLTVESDATATGHGLEMEFDLWRPDHAGNAPSHAMLVLCEDWVSAAYIATRCAGAVTVPLFRAHISAERMARLRKRFTHMSPWLDNDNPEVRKSAAYMTRLWRSMGGTSELYHGITDPKRLDVSEVCDEFERVRAKMRQPGGRLAP